MGTQVLDSNNGLQGLQSFTAGAGIRISDLELDYAYLPYGDLGTSHRVSLSYQFAMNPKRDEPVIKAKPEVTGPPPPAFKPDDGTQKNSLVLQFDEPNDETPAATPEPGMVPENLKLFQEAAQKDPKNVKVWWALGNVYFKMGLKTDALKCFGEVQKLQPDNKPFSDWLRKYQGAN